MDKDLTILLLLKDSSSFTWRWFKFYNQTRLPFRVLVADGGKDKSIEKLANKSLFPNIAYEYIRYPYDKDMITFFKKRCDALSRIKTKYTLLASNDDFYLPNSLSKSIKFLNENKDYVVARDDIYSFEIKNGQNQTEDVYGNIVNVEKLYSDKSNNENSASERILAASKYSNSLWHDICRTDALKESYDIMLDSGIIDLDLSDRLITYLLAVKGKIHRGKGLHMLHQSQKEGLGVALAKRDIFEWILSPEWPREVSKMFDILAEKTSEKDKISVEEARYKIMQNYICFIVGKKMIKEKIEKDIAKQKKTFLGRILPNDSKPGIMLRKFSAFVKNSAREISHRKIIDDLSQLEDFKRVQNFLPNNAVKTNEF